MSHQVEVDELPPCDFCAAIDQRRVDAVVDGATTMGAWANMCEKHYEIHGVGLGTGKGQRLVMRGA